MLCQEVLSKKSIFLYMFDKNTCTFVGNMILLFLLADCHGLIVIREVAFVSEIQFIFSQNTIIFAY